MLCTEIESAHTALLYILARYTISSFNKYSSSARYNIRGYRSDIHQSINGCALLSVGSIQVTRAGLAIGVVKVAVGAGVAVGGVELHSALAASRLFLAVASGVVEVAVTGCT